VKGPVKLGHITGVVPEGVSTRVAEGEGPTAEAAGKDGALGDATRTDGATQGTEHCLHIGSYKINTSIYCVSYKVEYFE